MTNPTDISSRVRAVLEERANLSTPIRQLNDSDDLYTHGLSSLATVEVMLAIEDEFEIELPERLLTRSTFESIDSISEVVGSLLASV